MPAPSLPSNEPTQNTTSETIARLANGAIHGIASHWLLLFNLAAGVYVLLPLLAPVLMQMGLTLPARVIYNAYSFACHQLPDHSYFLFGAAGHSHTPSLAVLEANGLTRGLGLFQQRTFIGNATLGFKAAICQRDIAIYGSIFLGGLGYGVLRQLAPRGRVPTLPWKYYLLFLIPIGMDGVTQMVGLRESNWWLRSATGALFGVASIWLAYPYVDEAMDELLQSERDGLGQNSTADRAE